MIHDLCVMLEYIPCTYGIICVYYVHMFMSLFFFSIMYAILVNFIHYKKTYLLVLFSES